MKKWRLIGGTLLGIVLLVVLIWYLRDRYAPKKIEGRLPHEWAAILDETNDPAERRHAAEALIEALRVTRGPARVYSVKPLALHVKNYPNKPLDLPSEVVPILADALRDRDCAVGMYSLVVLESMGPSAKEAVPALLDSLNGPNCPDREFARKALLKIDPDAAAKAGIR
jgi:hypothetical protein